MFQTVPCYLFPATASPRLAAAAASGTLPTTTTTTTTSTTTTPASAASSPLLSVLEGANHLSESHPPQQPQQAVLVLDPEDVENALERQMLHDNVRRLTVQSADQIGVPPGPDVTLGQVVSSAPPPASPLLRGAVSTGSPILAAISAEIDQQLQPRVLSVFLGQPQVVSEEGEQGRRGVIAAGFRGQVHKVIFS